MSDVPSQTVVQTGRCNQEGMEEAEVHWPVKGKGKGDVKIWHCVLLPEVGETGEACQEAKGAGAAGGHWAKACKEAPHYSW